MILLTSKDGQKVAIRPERVVAVARFEAGADGFLTGIFMAATETPQFAVIESPTEVAALIKEDIRNHEGWVMERQKLLWPNR